MDAITAIVFCKQPEKEWKVLTTSRYVWFVSLCSIWFFCVEFINFINWTKRCAVQEAMANTDCINGEKTANSQQKLGLIVVPYNKNFQQTFNCLIDKVFFFLPIGLQRGSEGVVGIQFKELALGIHPVQGVGLRHASTSSSPGLDKASAHVCGYLWTATSFRWASVVKSIGPRPVKQRWSWLPFGWVTK